MFTGIIEEIGEIVAIDWPGDGRTDARFVVRGTLAVSDAGLGDSIAVSGVCLTVTTIDGDSFSADVMPETIAQSALGALAPGDPVNLERAMAVGKRLGGHIVQGHVDGTAALRSRTPGERWDVLTFALPADLAPLIAHKGSITLDGVSLTVSSVGEDEFSVSLIPTTLAHTTLGRLEPGQRVNVETDVLARHVARLREFENQPTEIDRGVRE
ncbi:riboflavin synthase [Rarobacter faecitabidus]|uniref:Riboflavin synthase n=1 Tax=Rarobacter faecitabidus TaxID=13243 RepID=A0A542ZVM7_RARFA|nr:riboflavin synthase [Rarobacter faecitabidus]TQL64381.1 riboflavin synthase alpha chain [Rarobacter faecitabidus]